METWRVVRSIAPRTVSEFCSSAPHLSCPLEVRQRQILAASASAHLPSGPCAIAVAATPFGGVAVHTQYVPRITSQQPATRNQNLTLISPSPVAIPRNWSTLQPCEITAAEGNYYPPAARPSHRRAAHFLVPRGPSPALARWTVNANLPLSFARNYNIFTITRFCCIATACYRHSLRHRASTRTPPHDEGTSPAFLGARAESRSAAPS